MPQQSRATISCATLGTRLGSAQCLERRDARRGLCIREGPPCRLTQTRWRAKGVWPLVLEGRGCRGLQWAPVGSSAGVAHRNPPTLRRSPSDCRGGYVGMGQRCNANSTPRARRRNLNYVRHAAATVAQLPDAAIIDGPLHERPSSGGWKRMFGTEERAAPAQSPVHLAVTRAAGVGYVAYTRSKGRYRA